MHVGPYLINYLSHWSLLSGRSRIQQPMITFTIACVYYIQRHNRQTSNHNTLLNTSEIYLTTNLPKYE